MKFRLSLAIVPALLLLAGFCAWRWQMGSAPRSDESDRPPQQASNQVRAVQPAESPSRSSGGESMATAAAPVEPGAAKTNPGTFGKFFAKMLEDPQTKQFVRDQQATALNQLYAPLIQQMQLAPEQAERFRNLLIDSAMMSTELAPALIAGGSTNRVGTPGSPAQASIDEQVKDLIGAARYAQFKEYQATLTERMQLNSFKQQLSFGERALSDEQVERLLRIMKEEKTDLDAGGDAGPGAGQDLANAPSALADDQPDKLLQGQARANQRVYERAKLILNPAQLDAFARFQTNQLQSMGMGVSMARRLIAPAAPINP